MEGRLCPHHAVQLRPGQLKALRASAAPHERGALLLSQGRFRESILEIEGAALKTPLDADVLTDLSAAYLTRGRREPRSGDFILALDAANRALAAAPNRPEALFDRALALTRLHLTGEAVAAWKAYLAIDRDSDWARQGEGHLQDLEQPTLEELWQQERPRLLGALSRGGTKAVQEIAALLPDRSRRFCAEEVLPAWGSGAPVPGDFDPIAGCRLLGAALVKSAGDATVLDAVAAIEKSGHVAALQRGHRQFGEALAKYYDQDYEGARALFASAGEALAAGGSSFSLWTELYVAICDHYGGQGKARPRLEALVRRQLAARYPALVGRAEWMLGTIAAVSNQPEESLRWSRSGLARLAASGGPPALGVPYSQIASAYSSLGQPDAAWTARLDGLASTRRSGDLRHRCAILFDAAKDLLDQGQARLALPFSDELLPSALAYGHPASLTEASLQRARVLAGLRRDVEAERELGSAREHAAAIPGGDYRERIQASIDLEEGNLLANRDPRAAVLALSRSLDARLKQEYLYRIPLLLTARARAYRNLGDVARQEADLRAAISAHERTREDVRDRTLRLSSFEEAQAVFDEMVRLQVEQGDAREALSFAERARSRLLLDLVGASPGKPSRLPQAASAAEILDRLPDAVTLVEYFALPDKLLAWVLGRDLLVLVEIELAEKDLNRAIDVLRSAVERRAAVSEIQEAAGVLYDHLVRPLEAWLPMQAPVVFIPDHGLVRLPFAALYDRARGRFLVEDRTIALAPSATLYLAALHRKATLRPASAEALVVGNPAFDRDAFATLDPLEGADSEAREVAALYPGSDLLVGETATRRAFLTRASGHRVVHFGGHSLLDPANPQLSQLILAPEAGDRGALFARDLAGYRLDGTELVVLSACRTADSAAASRESLVGLAAAFLAAGPPSIVSSLWRVEDQATRRLMVAFHRALRNGSEPATALREAQLAQLSDRASSLRSPADWAGFEAFGAAVTGKN